MEFGHIRPDIKAAEAKGNLRALHEKYGVVVLRQVFTRRQISELRSYVRRLFQAEAPSETDRRQGVIPATHMVGGDPMINAALPGVYGIAEQLAGIALGGTVSFVPGASAFRQHRMSWRRSMSAVPYHRDKGVTPIGACSMATNVWIPLRSTGWGVPSLEFALGSHAVMRERPVTLTEHNVEDIMFLDLSALLADCPRWIPDLDVGDVAIFDQNTVHGTASFGPMLGRRSAELRFARG